MAERERWPKAPEVHSAGTSMMAWAEIRHLRSKLDAYERLREAAAQAEVLISDTLPDSELSRVLREALAACPREG